MTNPTNPTPAPQAPAPENLSAREFFAQDDSVLFKEWAIPQAEAAPEVSVEDEEGPAPDAPPPGKREVESIPDPAEGAEAAAPEVEVPKAERKLMTEFKVMDTEGELEIPEIQIEFKAKGETRKLPLDHVVRLAQFGFANEEREQQVLAAKRFVSEAQQKEAEYQQYIQQYEGYYDKIFNDPAFYEEARLAYLNQNAPEARAARAEQKLQQHYQAQQAEQEKAHIASFVQTTIMPSMSRVLQENPLVNENELIGRYTSLTAPLLVNGRVPLTRLREVEHIVNNDLALWAQQTQYERTIAKQSTERQAAKATQQVAQAKRQAARVFAQPGTVAQPNQKPTKFGSAKEWLDATFTQSSE
jgi:hypothetical protein